jgi:hypothetical protein
MILRSKSDSKPQARSTRHRDVAIIPAPERHWFVAGEGGYCAACNLPKRNRRHAERAA